MLKTAGRFRLAFFRYNMTDKYELKYSGIGRLYGKDAMRKLSSSHVCVVGVGGVGSWCVEALVRSGVGEITLVDMDDVCITNVNRQLPALESTVGQQKIDVLRERMLLINSDVKINLICDFYTQKTKDAILSKSYDYVVDAIDSVNNKAILLDHCVKLNLPVVTSGGAGGLRDPSRIAVADLAKTQGDSLLRVLRKKLRTQYDFPKNLKEDFGIRAVYSDEKAVFPSADGGVCEVPDKQSSLRLDCSAGFGTATFVTGSFGFSLASCVIRDLSNSECR